MVEVHLHDERVGLQLGADSLRLFLHTDAHQKNYESLSLARYLGYGQSLPTVRTVALSDVVSISIERQRIGPHILNIITKDTDPLWQHLLVHTIDGQVAKAKELVEEVKKVIK